MRAAALLNHYDYGRFVGAALASVAAQTRPLDEVLVVDDGSAPDELEALRSAASAHAGVRVHAKENGGQLSAFEAGIAETTADVVFFLDADDTWQPTYVERVMALLAERPDVDFVITTERRVFEKDGAEERVEINPAPTRDLGYSTARTLFHGGRWTGGPTSCLAIRRPILERIFPVPDAVGWRTSADEALVFGAGIAGARKYVLGEPLVNYRIHGENAWAERSKEPREWYQRGVEVQRLVELVRQRRNLPRSLATLAHREFRTIPEPTRKEYRDYVELVWASDLPLARRLRIRADLWKWYRRAGR